MGNACSGKGKRKQKLNLHVIDKRPSQTGLPRPSQSSQRLPQQLPRPSKTNFEFQFPSDYKTAEADQDLESFVQSMSFIKEHNDNNYSFYLFGEDLSKVRKTYLYELNNIKDMTVKISRQELLLMSSDNPEIMQFLKKNSIDVYALNQNSQGLNELMNISAVKKKIPNRDQLKQQETAYPEYLRLKYLKMADNNNLTGKSGKNLEYGDESKFLNTTYDAGEFLDKEEQEVLVRSSVLNKEGVLLPPWDPEKFELGLDMNVKSKNELKEFDQLLKIMAVENKINFDKNGLVQTETRASLKGKGLIPMGGTDYATNDDASKIALQKTIPEVLGELKPIVDDLKFENFYDKKFFAILTSIINYDQMFETNLIKRLIFPQKEGRGHPTQSGLHIVKLYINGCKRAFITQSLDIYKYLTARNEQYPQILLSALKMIYPNIAKTCPTVIIFRMCNWIPERMYVKDVGDVFTSYDKLKETFKAGNLILHWQEFATGKIRPVLDFTSQEKGMKRCIRTTKENKDESESELYLADWEELYNNDKIGNLYINWNPTIYSHRRTLHGLYWGLSSYKGGFDIPNFKLQRCTQFLLTMFPHKEVCETRIVIEKHKSMLNINYKLKYYLFSFSKGRIVLPNNPLREMEIKESEDEILSDILIFDENSNYENYVIVVQLTPENDSDMVLIKDDHLEIISVSLYTFADFDFLEMPYNNIDQFIPNFPHVLASKDKLEHGTLLDATSALMSPYYKLNLPKRNTLEIRVDSDLNLASEILVMNYENMRKSVSKLPSYLFKSDMSLGCNSLLVTLDEGTYAVKINFTHGGLDVERHSTRKSIKTDRFNVEKQTKNQLKTAQNFESVQVQFLNFGTQLAKRFQPLVIETNVNREFNRIKVEQVSLSNNLRNKKVLTGSWSKMSNFGTKKAKVNCYQKFMKNPGFIIRSEEESEFRFRLTVQKMPSNNGLSYICVAVFEIKDDFTFLTILEDDDYIQGNEFITEHLTLKPNKYGYLVLCLTLEVGFQSNFELEITSESKLKSFHDNKTGLLQFPYHEKLTGEISALSGGHISSPSFLLNDALSITFEDYRKDDNFFVELVTNNTSYPVSLYLIPTPKYSLAELSEMDINNYEYNPAFLYEVNSIFKPVTNQKYLIVPSSLETLVNSIDYEIKIQATCRFRVQKAPAPLFRDSFVIQQDDKFGKDVKFTLQQPDKVLIVVQPDVKNVKTQMAITNTTNKTQVFQSYSALQYGYIFKYLELSQPKHVFSLQVVTNKAVTSSIKIYSMIENNIQII